MSRYTNTDAKKRTFLANVEALERIVKPIVMAKKDLTSQGPCKHSPSPYHRPHYHEMEICFSCLSIHEPWEPEQAPLVRGKIVVYLTPEPGVPRKATLWESKISLDNVPDSIEGTLALVKTHPEQVARHLFDVKQVYDRAKLEEFSEREQDGNKSNSVDLGLRPKSFRLYTI